MKGLPEAWSKESPGMSQQQQRPNSLFESVTSTVATTVSSTGPNADLKDLYLQDLSDGMLSTYFDRLGHSKLIMITVSSFKFLRSSVKTSGKS